VAVNVAANANTSANVVHASMAANVATNVATNMVVNVVDNVLLRLLPKVDDMINNKEIAKASKNVSRRIVVESIREVIDEARNVILNGASQNEVEKAKAQNAANMGAAQTGVEQTRAQTKAQSKAVQDSDIIGYTAAASEKPAGAVQDSDIIGYTAAASEKPVGATQDGDVTGYEASASEKPVGAVQDGDVTAYEAAASGKLSGAALIDAIIRRIERKNDMSMRRVINGTGVILHTNLGRAPLSADIKEKVWEIAENYSTLEYNTYTGARGSRYSHVENLITSITGAESAFVVNNNAAAVMLALGALAKGGKVIVSRGELVEIGESFRLPEIMEQSGAKLVEVGSTNKTRLSDYVNAIVDGETKAILKVHTSNYRIVGFTEDTPLKDLARLGGDRGIPVVYDLGSGALVDLCEYGITGEMTASESISAGADVVCFSGDKLLGGPQAGIIAGKKSLLAKMRQNPLTRAFRIDKLSLAALEATLRIYLDYENATYQIPTLVMLTMTREVVRERAERLYGLLSAIFASKEEGAAGGACISIEDGRSQAGGGSFPLLDLPARVIRIKPENMTAQELEQKLRTRRTPIIARIHKDCVCLDARTIQDHDFPLIVSAFEEILI